MWQCRSAFFNNAVTILSFIAFYSRVLVLAESSTIDVNASSSQNTSTAATLILTRQKITGFSLLDNGFERGDYLKLDIETVHEGSKISVVCKDDVELYGLNGTLSTRVEIFGPVESSCGCLDSLTYFATDLGSGGGNRNYNHSNASLAIVASHMDQDRDSSHAVAGDKVVKQVQVQLNQIERNLPMVHSISPTHGSQSKETNVTISTEALEFSSSSLCSNLRCHFSWPEIEMEIPPSFIGKGRSCEEIICLVPPASIGLDDDSTTSLHDHVLIGLTDGTSVSNTVHFYYDDDFLEMKSASENAGSRQYSPILTEHVEITVEAIMPSRGPVSGGSSVLITSKEGFVDSPHLRCRFGDESVPGRWISSFEIECISPRQSKSGYVDVAIALSDTFYPSGVVQFEYYKNPSIVGFTPAIGPVVGGVNITVMVDQHLVPIDDFVCRFGLFFAPGYYINASALSCNLLPGHVGSSVPISISKNRGHDFSSRAKDLFQYVLQPSVQSVYPLFGWKSGGTMLTIRGTGFQPIGIISEISCLFELFGDDDTVVQPTYISDKEMHCESPVSAKTGSIPFRVVIGDGYMQSASSSFHYVEDYSVDSIFPNESHTAGGIEIALLGSNFLETDSIKCKFGNLTVNAIYEGLEKIVCICPSNPSGSVPISLSFDGMHFADTGFLFQYNNALGTHTDHRPDMNLTQSLESNVEESEQQVPIIDQTYFQGNNTALVVLGNNFVRSENFTCRFDSERAAVKWISRFQIECVLPKVSSKVSYLAVSNNGVDFVKSEGSFSTGMDFSILSTLYDAADRSVFVTGTSFVDSPTTSWSCFFNRHQVSAEILNPNELICPIPSHIYTAEISLQICKDEIHCAEGSILSVSDSISIVNVSPLAGFIEGEIKFQFSTKHSVKPSFSKCRFGRQVVDIFSTDEVDIYHCIVPPVLRPQKVDISISLNGKHFSGSGLSFEYLPIMTLFSLEPSRIIHGHTTPKLRVYGSGIVNADSLTCTFNGKAAGYALWVSESEVWCTIPHLEPGQANISLEYGGQSRAHTNVTLDVDYQSQATTVFPSCGPSGTNLTICGTNFKPESKARCHVGAVDVVSADLFNSSCYRCTVPFRESDGIESLSLSIDSSVPSIPWMQFKYVTTTVKSVDPLLVQRNSKSVEFKLIGDGFECLPEGTFCQIGDSVSDYVSVKSITSLSCSFGKFDGKGTYPLILKNPYFQIVSEARSITIVEAPIVAAVRPGWLTEGSTENVLDIHGENFIGDNFTCYINERQSTKALVTSSTRALCFVNKCKPGQRTVKVSNDGITMSNTGVTIQCLSQVVINSMHPSSGMSGTTINIIGVNFRVGIICNFRNGKVTSAFVVNSTLIQCPTPMLLKPSTMALDLTIDGRNITSSDSNFTFTFVDLAIASIHPNYGTINGGTVVSVRLRKGNGANVSHCWFGDSKVDATIVDVDEVICKSPQRKTVGAVRVGISTNGEDSTWHNGLFEYVKDATVSGVKPKSVSEIGGTIMIVSGYDFPNVIGLNCLIGEEVTSAEWISESMVQCQSPALAPGDYEVAISIHGKDHVFGMKTSVLLRVLNAVTLTSMRPSIGQLTGGTKLVLYGTNFFMSSSNYCFFGSKRSKAAFVSSNEIHCWTPSWTSMDIINVTVSLGEAVSTNSLQFLFVPPFQFSELNPKIVPVHGGNVSIIGGGPFQEVISYGYEFECIFGDKKVQAYWRGIDIICLSPPSNAGSTVNVLVRYGNDIFTVQNGNITYEKVSNATDLRSKLLPNHVQASSIYPEIGIVRTAHVISVIGRGFFTPQTIECKFGSRSQLVPAHVINSTLIQCPTPMLLKPSTMALDLTIDGRNITSSDSNFTFTFVDLAIASIHPNYGTINGGTVVSVRLRKGNGANVSHCWFGDSKVDATIVDVDEVICKSPQRKTVGAVRVGISTNGEDSTWHNGLFEYVKDATVSGVKPKSVSEIGGTIMIVSGYDFPNVIGLNCLIGEEVTSAEWISESMVQCQSPALAPGDYEVAISASGGILWRSEVLLIVHSNPVIEGTSVFEKDGSLYINIHCHNVVYSPIASCQFENDTLRASFVGTSLVICKLPNSVRHSSHQKIKLSLSLNNDHIHESTFVELSLPPLLREIKPTQGSSRGGTQVNFLGDFGNYRDENLHFIVCKFQTITVSALRVLGDGIVQCKSPSKFEGGYVNASISFNGGQQWSNEEQFLYVPPCQIEAVYPDKISTVGNTSVSIMLKNCDESTSLRCKFGLNNATEAVWVTSSEIRCRAPSHSPGVTQISLVDDSNTAICVPKQLEYSQPPIIYTYHPKSGAAHGGTEVRVIGRNLEFLEDPICLFGATASVASIIKSESIICKSPPMVFDNVVAFSIVDPLMAFEWTDERSFEYHEPPEIHSAILGGQIVTITGEHLNSTGRAWCRFTSDNVQSHIIQASQTNQSHVECSMQDFSSLAIGQSALVDMSLNQVDWCTKKVSFWVPPKSIRIKSVAPINGPISGGNAVFIETFLNSFERVRNIHCNFGDRSVFAKVISKTKIECISPHVVDEGEVPISLSLDNGPNHYTGYKYNFCAPCIVHGIHPKISYSGRGEFITVFGSNFAQTRAYTCQFDKVSVPSLYLNETAIVCSSPGSNIGDVDIHVLNEDGEQCLHGGGAMTDFLQYVAPASVSNVWPEIIPVLTATNVTVYGEGFNPDVGVKCQVGESNVPAEIQSSTMISCPVPKIETVGSMSLRLHVGTMPSKYIGSPLSLNIVAMPSIFSVTPITIASRTSTAIEVKGFNFHESNLLKCHFGHSYPLSPAKWLSSETLWCKTPTLKGEDNVKVAVTINDGYCYSNSHVLKTKPRLRLLSSNTLIGFTSESNILHAFMDGLSLSNFYTCTGDIWSVRAEILNNGTSVRCVLPRLERGSHEIFVRDDYESIRIGNISISKRPEIKAISPSHGIKEGGTRILLRGSNVEHVAFCVFRDTADSNIRKEYISEASITLNDTLSCTSPPSNYGNKLFVGLSVDRHTILETGKIFEQLKSPRVLNFGPRLIPFQRGNRINIQGLNFVDAKSLTCKFGSLSVGGYFISSESMFCMSPELPVGSHRVAISTNGADFVDAESSLVVYAPLSVHSIEPDFGSINGGEQVMVKVTNARSTAALQCRFGLQLVPAVMIDLNTYSCYAPKVLREQEVSISVSINGANFHSGHKECCSYNYVRSPLVLKIEPSRGPRVGGTRVRLQLNTIITSLSEKLACHFGAENQVYPVKVGSNYVDCIAPSATFGISEHRVSLHYSVSAFTSFEGPIFTYLEPMLLVNVFPISGSMEGGTVATVTGINIPHRDDLKCIFGDIEIIGEYINDHSVRCSSPPQKQTGTVRVEVSSVDDTLNTYLSTAYFDYIPMHSVHSIQPDHGSLKGGTQVTVVGSKFTSLYPDLLRCRFGAISVPAQFISAHEMRCISPALNSPTSVGDEIEFGVSLNAADFVFEDNINFRYVRHNVISSIHPKSGQVTGGSIVTVNIMPASHVMESTVVRCHFGDLAALADDVGIFDDFIRIHCIAPAVEEGHAVPLEISVNDHNDITSKGLQFTFYDNPTVGSIHPQSGFSKGGELVSIYGKNFIQSETSQCMFGRYQSPRTKWISSTEILCVTPSLPEVGFVSVRVSGNGEELTGTGRSVIYQYKEHPIFDKVTSDKIAVDGSTLLNITGRHLSEAIECRFGKFAESVPVLDNSNDFVLCRPPAQNSSSLYINQSVGISVSFQAGFVDTGLAVSYGDQNDLHEVYQKSLDDHFHTPKVDRIMPSMGPSSGGTWITVVGSHFSNFVGLQCLFGENTYVKAFFISNREIKCQSPRIIPGQYHLCVVNGGKSGLKSEEVATFHVVKDVMIAAINPSFGPLPGGTEVIVMGNFHSIVDDLTWPKLSCWFGSVEVPAILQDSSSVICASPPVLNAETVELTVSFNGERSMSSSFFLFSFRQPPEIVSLNPSIGDIRGSTRVLVEGRHFVNNHPLRCRFGTKSSPGIFISSSHVMCTSPSQIEANDVRLEITVNGIDYTDSKVLFRYRESLVITSVSPPTAFSSIHGTKIYISATGVSHDLKLFCIYDHFKVDAEILDLENIVCTLPASKTGSKELKIATAGADHASFMSKPIQYEIHPAPKITSVYPKTGNKLGRLPLFIKGAGFVNNTNLECQFNDMKSRAFFIRENLIVCSTPPLLNQLLTSVRVSLGEANLASHDSWQFEFTGNCGEGHYCGYSSTTWRYPAPNGTFAPGINSLNFTLCSPGTFSPRVGLSRCLSCGVGYTCPDFGMSKPLICQPGKVCDRMGLVSPSSSCPKGHICLAGTKSRSPLTSESNDEWVVDKETGIATENRDEFHWSQRNREPPATGKYWVEHPPKQNLTAEQPIPCDIGFYCREGVATTTSILGNFSTPQRCYDGFFCPRGSFTPEGSGPCKPGFYCPTPSLAIAAPEGHHCAGVGNTKPIECHPGTYSDSIGRSSCSLCEKGTICPEWGMVKPKLCPAGFICDTMGLSVPYKSCTPGFICLEGTTTEDIDANVPTRPLPCPAGNFCLSGVAHNKSIEWLPTQVEGKFAPQKCHEGYYCEEGSPSPSGICFSGHYCPLGTPYPKKVPVGTFAEEGAIIPALCFPGSYTASAGSNKCVPCPAGHSCEEYGTSVPSICNYGTYRSVTDSITCKPCPPATYLPYRGGTDISECMPIPPGRVSGKKGMHDLSMSEPCGGSHVCSCATEGSNQYDHKCPSGHICSLETTPWLQHKFLCESGYQCKRGTSEELKHRDRCAQKQFCPTGTSDSSSESNQCPRQTFSNPGSKSTRNCNIQDVGICDKVDVNPKNPGEYNTYYSDHQYYPLDHSATKMIHISSSVETGFAGEAIALKKISPIRTNSSSKLWRNETVEVFRSCPSYTITKNATEWVVNNITLIGRNFHPSKALTCRYRIKAGNEAIEESEPFEVRTKGAFLSTTRISCELPIFVDIQEHLDEVRSLNPTCVFDSTGSVFYKKQCSDNADAKCVGSYIKKDRHERHYSLFVPCDKQEIDLGQCEETPSIGFKVNPCFSINIVIDASNDGKRFSGNETLVPYTRDEYLARRNKKNPLMIPSSEAFLTVIDPSLPWFYKSESSSEGIFKQSEEFLRVHQSSCMIQYEKQESRRSSEAGWFSLPFMSQAHLSIDWRHIPSNIVYDEHFKLAIFVIPSRCSKTLCNDRRVRINDEETTPCVKPLPLPDWFTDNSVDKRQLLNLTLLALDDVLFKAEVHMMHGLYLPSSGLFKNSVTVHIVDPHRAPSVSSARRTLSPYLSWEENQIPMELIFASRLTPDETRIVSPPLNLPPRWNDLERGRVLVSMNTTHDSTIPTIKDGTRNDQTNSFWSNPFATTEDAKVSTDAFLETFHGINIDSEDSYKYDMKSLMLPYLPFFSNCREFDSYIPLSHVIASNECTLPDIGHSYPFDWWRRDYQALPHRDDIKSVGPLDFDRFYPTADWCERKIYCEYEEELPQQDVTPRWFEAGTGTTIFSVLRDPVNYFQYTGRQGYSTDIGDGGGNKFIKSIDLFDNFIPVKVLRRGDSEDCHFLCFPRKLSLDISYHQINETSKRLIDITLTFEDFDKDAASSQYEIDLKLYPLNYQELIVKFAFSKDIYLVLFSLIGIFTVAIAFLYWVLVRLTTQIEHPPKLRFGSTLWLIFPQALCGFSLGLLPIAIITTGVTVLIKGYLLITPDLSSIKLTWPIFQATPLHYKDVSIDPQLLEVTRQGRLGMAFVVVAIVSIFEGSKMFVPRRNSKRERELELSREKDASKTMVWDVILWKRSNLILSSILMGLLLVMIVEWSYWSLFGTYIWEAILFLKILGYVVGAIVDNQMGESLLSAPIMTSMSLVESIVTLSAVDFLDFLLSYVVGFGFLLLERMYIAPYQQDVLDWLSNRVTKVLVIIKSKLEAMLQRLGLRQESETEPAKEKKSEAASQTGATVEPIIDSYGSYCSETLSLLYVPYIIILLMIFRDDLEISTRYGIKEKDMEYYAMFAVLIIPFQIISDIFLHGSLELFHGWKIYDYLVYTRYRFTQRATRWKGFEDSLDECIDESVRTMDHMCFSTQFYMMMTIHVNGIIFMVFGIEMINRAQYNLFGDPAMPAVVIIVVIGVAVLKQALIWLSLIFGIWNIRHENTAWHANMRNEDTLQLPDWDGIKGASHDAFEMNKKISDESFRYKFMNYNRSWLIEQLPNVLTPRALRRSRPFLTNQLARVIQTLNDGISSDSDSELDTNRFQVPTNIPDSAEHLLKDWMKEARRRLMMKDAVQPFIEKERKSHCESCLSNKALKIQMEFDLDKM